MGCCASEAKTNPEESLILKIKETIESNSPEVLWNYFTVLDRFSKNPNRMAAVDRPIIQTSSYTLNALGYSLFIGSLKSFRFIYENLEAEAKTMEEIFQVYGLSGINIICEKGYYELLQYYITIYEEIHSSLSPSKNKLTTIQQACKEGKISIVSFLYSYFRDKFGVPDGLNVHFVHAETKENCALVACRAANFPLIKFLHETCNTDFKIVNAEGLNAIGVILKDRVGSPNELQCVKYLVKTIGIEAPEGIQSKKLKEELSLL